MIHIVFGTILFLQVLQYFVIADVALSWLPLLGIRFRPKFLASILDPLYSIIKTSVPTGVGPFDMTALLLLFLLAFLIGLLVLLFPAVKILFL